jgi:hypothetical protein
VVVEEHDTGLELLDASSKQEVIVADSVGDLYPKDGSYPFCTLISSGFNYDRCLIGGRYYGQDPSVYWKRQVYQDIFKNPHQDIVANRQSSSFISPTLRVVNGCSEDSAGVQAPRMRE